MSELVLISIHPRHVEAILAGEKTIEFRRRWTAREVGHLVIYATVPVKRIVALVPIDETFHGSPTVHWNLAQQHCVGGSPEWKSSPASVAYSRGTDCVLAAFNLCDNLSTPSRNSMGFVPHQF